MTDPGRRLYRDAALLVDGGRKLRPGMSLLVEGGRVAWIRPVDEEPAADGARIVDASGCTVVPGMVDAHSHLTLPGGAHWIERGRDPPERLVAVAEHNAELQRQAGVRWARDVGSVRAVDPVDGKERALALGVRDRWKGRTDRPYVRSAGTWITRAGTLPEGLGIAAADPAAFLAAAAAQLDEGADFLKLYLDGPTPGVSPWAAEEIRPVVELARGRGAKVTAHTSYLDGARAGVEAGVDALEHGFELDAELAARMQSQGTFLVSTLAVFRSWATFARTTSLARFAGEEGRDRMAKRRARAVESVAAAHRAGVRIATGTDFGGGSLRPNQLAWEVESLVEAGLAPWEALASATRVGGELLGEPEAGTVREGGPADFFLVHGDPLSDPTALWRVWRVAWADGPA